MYKKKKYAIPVHFGVYGFINYTSPILTKTSGIVLKNNSEEYNI